MNVTLNARILGTFETSRIKAINYWTEVIIEVFIRVFLPLISPQFIRKCDFISSENKKIHTTFNKIFHIPIQRFE